MTQPSIDFDYPTKANGRIPSFQNVEEEAEFWDTHDVTEFIEVELQPIEITIGSALRNRMEKKCGTPDPALEVPG